MKGKTNNPNGRPRGSGNKVSAEVRQLLAELVSQKLQPKAFDALWNELEGPARAKLLAELVKYVVAPAPQEEPTVGADRGMSFYAMLNGSRQQTIEA